MYMALILVAILADNPPLVSKPSDVLGWIMIGGLLLFFTWICFVVGKNFDAFMRGMAWVIVLVVVAIVLIAVFQAGHPGQ